MTVNFSTPLGSVNVSFAGSIKALTDSGILDPQAGQGVVSFSTNTAAPIKAYTGQIKAH